MKLVSPPDFNFYPAQNFVMESSPTTPATPVLGQLWVDTSDSNNPVMKTYLGPALGWTPAAGGTGSGFSNPMTLAGDIIVGGASGTPERLGKGTDGQVLTIVAGEPAYADVPGLTNPMTTDGDILTGGASGTPTRLPVGSNGDILSVVAGRPSYVAPSVFGVLPAIGTDGQVLTVVAGAPAYADPTGGSFTNPMTTPGDIIVGGVAGAPSRLAKGTDGFVLTMVAGVPAYAPAPASSSASAVTKLVSQATHGFVVGNLIYHNGTVYALANAAQGDTSEVVGIVSAVHDANSFDLTSSGFISGLTGLTPGQVYYLSALTAGGLSIDPPASAGQISIPVFVSTSATTGWFKIERGIVVPSNTGGLSEPLTITAPAEIVMADGLSIRTWVPAQVDPVVPGHFPETTSDKISNGESYPFYDVEHLGGKWVGDMFTASVPAITGATYKWTAKGAINVGDTLLAGVMSGGGSDATTKNTLTFGAQVWQSITLSCAVSLPGGEVVNLTHFIPVKQKRTCAEYVPLPHGTELEGILSVLKWKTGNGVFLAGANHITSVNLDTMAATLLAGTPSNQATFTTISNILHDIDGHLIVVDQGGGKIHRVDTTTGVVTLAADGFAYASHAAVAPDGSIYVADSDGGVVKKIAVGGVVTVVAGMGGFVTLPPTEGSLGTNRLNSPTAVAFVPTWDAAGDRLFIADSGYIMSLDLTSTNLAWQAGTGAVGRPHDASGTLLRFTSKISQLAAYTDPDTTKPGLYFIDSNYLRKITDATAIIPNTTYTVGALGGITGGGEGQVNLRFSLDFAGATPGILIAEGSKVYRFHTHLKVAPVEFPTYSPVDGGPWGTSILGEEYPLVYHYHSSGAFGTCRVSAFKFTAPIGGQMAVQLRRPVDPNPSLESMNAYVAQVEGDTLFGNVDALWSTVQKRIVTDEPSHTKFLYPNKVAIMEGYQDFIVFAYTGDFADFDSPVSPEKRDNIYTLGVTDGFRIFVSTAGALAFSADSEEVSYNVDGSLYQVQEFTGGGTSVTRYFYNPDKTVNVVLVIENTDDIGPTSNTGALVAKQCVYEHFGGVKKLVGMETVDPVPFMFYTAPAISDENL